MLSRPSGSFLEPNDCSKISFSSLGIQGQKITLYLSMISSHDLGLEAVGSTHIVQGSSLKPKVSNAVSCAVSMLTLNWFTRWFSGPCHIHRPRSGFLRRSASGSTAKQVKSLPFEHSQIIHANCVVIHEPEAKGNCKPPVAEQARLPDSDRWRIICGGWWSNRKRAGWRSADVLWSSCSFTTWDLLDHRSSQTLQCFLSLATIETMDTRRNIGWKRNVKPYRPNTLDYSRDYWIICAFSNLICI